MTETKIVRASATADEIYQKLTKACSRLKLEKKLVPCLAIILAGNDPASEVYVRNKIEKAKEVGIKTELHRLPEDAKPQEITKIIEKLNAKTKVHGIIVQLPLPKASQEYKDYILTLIPPFKDVDCFHPLNLGTVYLGTNTIVPCTAYGVIQLLEQEGVEVKGKHVAIVGMSNIVGKPLAMEMIQREATVTTCNIHTKNLKDLTSQADILVTAIGKPNYFDASYVKKGAIVIDVGINKIANPDYDEAIAKDIDRRSLEKVAEEHALEGETPIQTRNRLRRLARQHRLVGDVDAEKVTGHASMLSAVPGGAGVLTVANLLTNTVKLALYQKQVDPEAYGLN